MTGEEFTCVLQLIHKDLSWNYGPAKTLAGVVLRDGAPNPVKLMAHGRTAEETLQKLIEEFEKSGVKV